MIYHDLCLKLEDTIIPMHSLWPGIKILQFFYLDLQLYSLKPNYFFKYIYIEFIHNLLLKPQIKHKFNAMENYKKK